MSLTNITLFLNRLQNKPFGGYLMSLEPICVPKVLLKFDMEYVYCHLNQLRFDKNCNQCRPWLFWLIIISYGD